MSKTYKETCSSSSSHNRYEGPLNIIQEVDSSRIICDVESIKICLVETSTSFLLSNIPLDKPYSSSSLIEENIHFDKVSLLLDDKSYKDNLSTDIILSIETIRVDFHSSSKEFFFYVIMILRGFLSLFIHISTVESTH